MTTDPTFDEMAAALSAATMEIDTAEIQSRRAAASLAMAELSTLDLVAAACGAPVPGSAEAIESAIREHDGTWVTGRGQEVVRIVAAVALTALLREPDRRILAALACESAAYLGYEPGAPGLLRTAEAVTFDVSTASRARADIAALKGASRKLLTGEQELEGPQAVAAVRALARRFDEVVEQVSIRLDRMDEELNSLWWSRKSFHSASSAEWEQLPAMERVVRATIEIEELVHIAPAARGTVEVLNERVGNLDTEPDVSILDIAEELAGSAHAALPHSHFLLPLSTVASSLAIYPGQRDVVSTVIAQSTGLDPSQVVGLRELGAQLLRENSMMRVM
ncbi:hypothetical protein E3T28_09265 [Cryobacterium sinapicolor]|uniref:GTPase-associated system helical domain-containing protein n=1 Tax=Cryobacterium sinapicolor TaxID=1259236 RepID=A0ABY2J3A4_9MICO|nr:GTPase-associated system all-helical protein GASH [Cryobacterium sinapicolor]TFC99411.1 hypothetical protein E3T28_09265 [Cryobacterium sinapicolor]